MTHLETLDGAPLEWPTLLQRVAAYWETHDRYGVVLPVFGCMVCTQGRHGTCTGTRYASRTDHTTSACECSARGHAA